MEEDKYKELLESVPFFNANTDYVTSGEVQVLVYIPEGRSPNKVLRKMTVSNLDDLITNGSLGTEVGTGTGTGTGIDKEA